MRPKHINTIVPPVLNAIFVKSINIMLGSVETSTRIPLELKPRRIISIIGTVTGNASIPQAIVAPTLGLTVLALPIAEEVPIAEQVPTAEEVPMAEGILVAKTSHMVGVLLMAEKVVVAEIVPTMGVTVRTKMFRRLGFVPVVRLASMVKAVAMAEVIVITAHRGNPHHEACTIRL